MTLSNKYNVPQETINKMVNDGVISCSWPMYEEIYTMFKNSLSAGGKTKTDIYYEIAEKKGISPETVKHAVNKFR